MQLLMTSLPPQTPTDKCRLRRATCAPSGMPGDSPSAVWFEADSGVNRLVAFLIDDTTFKISSSVIVSISCSSPTHEATSHVLSPSQLKLSPPSHSHHLPKKYKTKSLGTVTLVVFPKAINGAATSPRLNCSLLAVNV